MNEKRSAAQPIPENGNEGTQKKNMSKMILKAANTVINFFVVLALCTAGIYAGYALWDNNRIYAAADDVQADMIKIKPDMENDEEGASFEELLALNPDVCAWVTLDNTKVDYPVLQGETNLTYINKDVYGNFALAGSIYLDSRNDDNFSDTYAVLYGHHMEKGSMFGDLDLYKKKSFFKKNTTGILMLPDRAYKLEIFACLLIKASDDVIFDPEKWQTDIEQLLSYVESNAVYLHKKTLNGLRESRKPQVLALTTCSSEFTDARTIVLAAMKPYKAAE